MFLCSLDMKLPILQVIGSAHRKIPLRTFTGCDDLYPSVVHRGSDEGSSDARKKEKINRFDAQERQAGAPACTADNDCEDEGVERSVSEIRTELHVSNSSPSYMSCIEYEERCQQ